MPTPQRRKPVAVVSELLADPHRFGFFQAVRLLERWLGRGAPTGVGPGAGRTPAFDERIAFRNNLSLAFPPSEIAALVLHRREAETTEAESDRDGSLLTASDVERIELTPAFFGLLGAGGALPTHYTELLVRREEDPQWRRHPNRDAPRAFYDLFLHRSLVLFYQAWRKHRLPLQFEADRRARWLPLLLAVAGMGQPALRDRLRAREGGVADEALAFYAATLQRRPVSASALARVLGHYFNVPVRLDNFVGRWFELPEANRSHLGLSNMQLGRDLVCGGRVWQRDLRLRLTFGPLDHTRFSRFLPGGPAALALRELLALLLGATLEVEVRLLLRAADVRGSQLGTEAPRLGWDSFLLTQPATRDRADAGYDLMALA
jgi:type VI secretion system protein ImpH